MGANEMPPKVAPQTIAAPDAWVIVDAYQRFDEGNCRALLQWPGVLLKDPATAKDPALAALAWDKMAPGLYWTEWSCAFASNTMHTGGAPTVDRIRAAVGSIGDGYAASLLVEQKKFV